MRLMKLLRRLFRRALVGWHTGHCQLCGELKEVGYDMKYGGTYCESCWDKEGV